MTQPRPWRRAFAWLAFLGPFFFASYGFANWLASRRSEVGAVAFNWERGIPFVPWTIVPYWSIDLLYVVSIFVCTTRRELDRHAQRLLAVQLVSIAFFIALPLRFLSIVPRRTVSSARCSRRSAVSTSRSIRRRRCTSGCSS